MVFSLSSVQLSFRVLSLFALIFADLVFSVPTAEILRRDSIEEQLTVKAASRCSILDEDDVRSREYLSKVRKQLLNNTPRSVPGWPKVEKYVTDTWGEGNYTVKINPSNVCYRYALFFWLIQGLLQYRDKRATICIVDPIQIKPPGMLDLLHKL